MLFKMETDAASEKTELDFLNELMNFVFVR
jgi:hypothetical protein